MNTRRPDSPAVTPPRATADGARARLAPTPTDGAGDGPSDLSFAEAVELFVGRTRHTRSGSPHTEAAYRADLRHYAAHLARRGLAYDALSRRDAERYLVTLSAEHSARTVRRRVSCVRSFYRFLRTVEAVAHNPFDAALDLPDVDRKSETHKVLTDDELAHALRLLAADVARARQRLGDRPSGRAFARLLAATRRRAAVTLMALAGLRRAEVVGLTKDALVERPDGFSLRFSGKGGKTRTVPLSTAAHPALVEWLAVRVRVPTAAPQVFVTTAGRPVDPQQVKRDCVGLGARVGTRFRLTPHVLRRTFATRALRASGDIRAVQVLLGHASIQTTEVYTHVDEDGLRALVESTRLDAPRTSPPDRPPVTRQAS